MDSNMPRINFVVGEERRLAEIISRYEIEPLLASLVKAGPAYASVLDEDGLPICCQGRDDPQGSYSEICHPLLVEGEPQGTLKVLFDPSTCTVAGSLAKLAHDVIQLTVTNNLKRMLTTEMHTSIVQESYEQLLSINKSLKESEGRYRELAVSLEQKVEERTAELKKAYARMLQQEKLAAVGGLAAGMAHEINNPNGFVLSNLTTLSRYLERIKEMLDYYRQLQDSNMPPLLQSQAAEKKLRELKLDFILTDTDELISQSIDGARRIARIIEDLKSFSHVDEAGDSDADLNVELERVLAVLAPQIPADAVIVRDLQKLPLVGCNPALVSQAFLNIIQNALQSRSEELVICLESRIENGDVVIRISDNGCGIRVEDLPRVFEPFYTTREVGNGTGMGLTVARENVCHAGGTVEIDSTLGSGTAVTVRVPLKPV
jgi:two-component system, NtrC family, sensor kinase